MDILAYINPTLDKNGISWMIWIWLSIVVIATVIEIFTMDMSSIWFSVAGVVSMIMAVFPSVSWEAQLIVFVVISIAALLGLRPIAKKYLLKKTDGKTNADLIIGKTVKAIDAYNEENLGTAEINGVVWNICEQNNTPIQQGEKAEVVGIEGNKLIVKKLEIKSTIEEENV